MLEPEIERALRSEGFRHIYDWRDEPHTEYPDHAHLCLTAHIILEGEMKVTIEGRTHIYRADERFDVPADTVHSAKMGPAGCRYVVGENYVSASLTGTRTQSKFHLIILLDIDNPRAYA